MMSAQLGGSRGEKSSTTGDNSGGTEPAISNPSPPSAATASTLPAAHSRAGQGKSPYVLSQRESEINWELFDDEAVRRAKEENKLIFLHIGYCASHYCHLTVTESFSHPRVIETINTYFVPILLDSEERPDLNHIYSQYIHSLNSVAGHPLNIFLTPELQPVFGSTYIAAPGSHHHHYANTKKKDIGLNSAGGGAGGGGADDSRDVVDDVDDDLLQTEEPADFWVTLSSIQASWMKQEQAIRQNGAKAIEDLRRFTQEGQARIGDNFTTRTIGNGGLSSAFGKSVSAVGNGGFAATGSNGTSAGSKVAATSSTNNSGNSKAEDTAEVDLEQIEEACSHIAKTFDRTHGGFLHMPSNAEPTFLSGKVDVNHLKEAYDFITTTPKFLTPTKYAFLLAAPSWPAPLSDIIGEKLATYVSKFAVQSLRQIIAGGVHDHIGGGFHHYSCTWDWALPSFEKLMPDNALMLGVFLDAWKVEGMKMSDPDFPAGIHELAEYLAGLSQTLEREVGAEVRGGIPTAEAADSCARRGDRVMQNGAYCLWTRKEFNSVIGDEQESTFAGSYWGVKEHGNVDKTHDPHDDYLNRNVLRVVRPLVATDTEARRRIESARARLRKHRETERPRPAVVTSVVAAYNGMAIAALAKTAAMYFHHPELDDALGLKYLEVANGAARFIQSKLWDAQNKTLYRMWYGGQRTTTPGMAEDYAFLIEGLLELYQVSADEAWVEWADELQRVQIELFFDKPAGSGVSNAGVRRGGGFFMTERGAPHVLLQIKDAFDAAQPSTNSISVANLFRLGALLNCDEYTAQAVETVSSFDPEILQYPYLFPGMLKTIVWWKLGVKRRVAISGGKGSGNEYVKKLWKGIMPHEQDVLVHFDVSERKESVLTKRASRLVESLMGLGEGVYQETITNGKGRWDSVST